MTKFAALFPRAELSAQFDRKVTNTLTSSKQLHSDLVELLQGACAGVSFETNSDGSMNVASLSQLYKMIEKGKPFTILTTRLIHTVLVLSLQVIDANAQVPELHEWAKPQVKAEKPKATTPAPQAKKIDVTDIIGGIASVMELQSLQSIIDTATARMEMLKAKSTEAQAKTTKAPSKAKAKPQAQAPQAAPTPV